MDDERRFFSAYKKNNYGDISKDKNKEPILNPSPREGRFVGEQQLIFSPSLGEGWGGK